VARTLVPSAAMAPASLMLILVAAASGASPPTDLQSAASLIRRLQGIPGLCLAFCPVQKGQMDIPQACAILDCLKREHTCLGSGGVAETLMKNLTAAGMGADFWTCVCEDGKAHVDALLAADKTGGVCAKAPRNSSGSKDICKMVVGDNWDGKDAQCASTLTDAMIALGKVQVCKSMFAYFQTGTPKSNMCFDTLKASRESRLASAACPVRVPLMLVGAVLIGMSSE